MIFPRLRKFTQESLPVAMSGVRMGEKLLQIGPDDPTLMGAIAAKVGLSGSAAAVAADESSAEKARAGAAKAAALVDLQVAPLDALPFPDDGFDVVVVHSTKGWLASMADTARLAVVRDAFRVLRSGGRIIVIESPKTALADVVELLSTAGFRPARLLAEREGYRFAEGLKSASQDRATVP